MHKEESVLLTGVAGFIGFHVAQLLLREGYFLIGVDSISTYYDTSLKYARLKILKETFPDTFIFCKGDIADRSFMEHIWHSVERPITRVVHLAAQAGVRYSLENPYEYITTNVMGHLVLLEQARHQKDFKHFVYASSSSVYGANEEIPFSEEHRTEKPMALYAVTKQCDELMSRSYAHLFKIPSTGLRFFTVYGPWGRPDMALFIFTKKILAGEPIPVFNNGQMKRDFTYIDDIAAGVVAAFENPPAGDVPHKVYNLGNHKSEPLMRYIELIEKELGKKAQYTMLPMQPGDVPESFSDITRAQKELGFEPKTNIDQGVKNFVEWYRSYYAV
jgi:UDP-glucuronate 4-epimerase